MTILEVRKYFDDNKHHLPPVPFATSVCEKIVDLDAYLESDLLQLESKSPQLVGVALDRLKLLKKMIDDTKQG